MRVLILLTTEQGGHEAVSLGRNWVERFAAIYYRLNDASAEIVLASTEGGPPTWGLPQGDGAADSAATARLRDDRQVRDQLADTLRFDQIFLEDFDAVVCFGCSGRDDTIDGGGLPVSLIADALGAGMTVAAVCADLAELPREIRSGLLIVGSELTRPDAIGRALLASLEGRDAR
ncbi:MAG: hypothetical protein GC206_15135 [Alphaproteobacteria bacterium]|nr:hypothetical protein [Alphaproteobacteria bacterium]